jgi:NADH dehydrogenase
MRVVVFGAGYAGLTVARQLERKLSEDIELVVVDESDEHLVQHELHRVIRHPALDDAITVSLENVFSRADIRQATVTNIDTEEGVAVLDGEEELEYDVGAVCLGSETAFYGLDGVEEAATPLKSLDDARSIREQAFDAAGGTAVVGGGGLSGIQAAGELAALSDHEDLDLDVKLVEMEDHVAPGFDTTFAVAIRDELDARDVAVETGREIESADDASVTFADGETIDADVFVWTGGIRGPASLDGRRQETDNDLRVGDSTYVVGDSASLVDVDGSPVPASAQTAVRQGRVGAANILQDISETDTDESEDGEEHRQSRVRYEHATVGWVVTIGDGAVARVGPVVFSGEPARAAKAVIGFGHLSSVGAVRQASELVAEEMGWPTARGLGVIDDLDGRPSSELPTDPATPGEVGDPLTTLMTVFGATLPGDEPVDMTTLTRQFDRTAPDNILRTVQNTVFGSLDEVLGSGTESDEEMVTIDVESGTDPGPFSPGTPKSESEGSDDTAEGGEDGNGENNSGEDNGAEDDSAEDDSAE